ncbi:MAG: ABC transporter substrate-binding protein [Opitutae bacterium]|nr:ABC transporter substrate-binding protein [Opitutae bacterium]
MKKLFTALILIGFVTLAAIFYLRKGGSSAGEHASAPTKVDKVSVRMKWFFAGTMTGWFSGVGEGIFGDNGIALSISPGGPDNSSIKLVAAGTDSFGVAGADEVLLARAKGIPIVAIGVLFKESPICFVSKREKHITSPSDWTGKTVEVSYGDNSEIQFRALLAKYNVKNVKEVPYTFNLLPLIEDKVDVSVAYKMDQVITLQNQGIALDVISAKDHGINPYADVVITTEKILKENPELVRRFMRATVRSFQWAIDNQPTAVNHLIQAAPNLKRENEAKVWSATIPFLTADGGTSALGSMERARWEETQRILIEFKALAQPVDLSKAFVDILH